MKINEIISKYKTLFGHTVGEINYSKAVSEKPWDGNFVISDIDFNLNTLKECPKIIYGSFNCSNQSLKTLEDGPNHVGGDYICFSSGLTSLKGIAKFILSNIDCSHNKLKSLDYLPDMINGSLDCSYNELTSFDDIECSISEDLIGTGNKIQSLHNIHKHLKAVNGKLFLRNNPLSSHILGVLLIEGCTEIIIDNKDVQNIVNSYLPNKKGREAIFDCQDELINAGFEEYAQL